MEEERVRAAADAAHRDRILKERAAREAEERERREREARDRAEALALAEVERRAREEAARIEAIHRATVETARTEAEAKARAAARELERRHELELERAHATSAGARTRGVVLSAVFGVVVAGGVAVALHYGVVVPNERVRATEADGAMASRDVVIADLRAREQTSEARLHVLEEDAITARAENERLRSELEVARRSSPLHVAPRSSTAVLPNVPPPLNGFATCPPGSKDPMCLR